MFTIMYRHEVDAMELVRELLIRLGNKYIQFYLYCSVLTTDVHKYIR